MGRFNAIWAYFLGILNLMFIVFISHNLLHLWQSKFLGFPKEIANRLITGYFHGLFLCEMKETAGILGACQLIKVNTFSVIFFVVYS